MDTYRPPGRRHRIGTYRPTGRRRPTDTYRRTGARRDRKTQHDRPIRRITQRVHLRRRLRHRTTSARAISRNPQRPSRTGLRIRVSMRRRPARPHRIHRWLPPSTRRRATTCGRLRLSRIRRRLHATANFDLRHRILRRRRRRERRLTRGRHRDERLLTTSRAPTAHRHSTRLSEPTRPRHVPRIRPGHSARVTDNGLRKAAG